MKARFAIALLAISMLCASAMAQENTADYWYKTGMNLTGNGSYEKAVEAYENAIKLSPKNATLWDAKASSQSMAAVFSKNRSEYNESLKAEDKAIELDPKNSTLWVNKAFLDANLADLRGHNESGYQDALKDLDRAIEINPQDKRAWLFKGAVLDSRLNKYDEALAAYDKAIEIGGTNASDKVLLSNAWEGKGYALSKLGKYNESFEALDKAIELSPQNAGSIWYTKAEALNNSGRYDDALKAYDRSIELKGPMDLAYEGKGEALFKLGKYNDAVKAYDEAIELFQLEASGSAWYKKGIALKALDKTSESDAAFAKAKELGYQE